MLDICFLGQFGALADAHLGTVDAAANLLIASCYYIIGSSIALGLWRNRHEGVDLLVVCVAGIFISCGLGHTAHGTGMLGLWNTIGWQTGFDLFTIIPATGFLSFHSSYGILVRFSQIVKSEAALEQRNVTLEQLVEQRTQELREQNERLNNTLIELQQMQGHLIQMEKMSLLGQMVSGISHEINNPVNFIYGNLPYVEEHVRDIIKVLEAYQTSCEEESEHIQKVKDEIELNFVLDDLQNLVDSMKVGAARIRELVLNLRSFYRLDEAQMKYADLHAGIESTLVLLSNRYKKKIEIAREFGDIPQVECYINQVNQVFMNLISNAIDALIAENSSRKKEPKRIAIATQLIDADWVAVKISDNGPGIPVEIQNRIFEPLFTTKARDVGTGLGLSISQQIVTETHRGRIYCYSTPGEGTTFTVELPVVQEKAEEVAGVSPEWAIAPTEAKK